MALVRDGGVGVGVEVEVGVEVTGWVRVRVGVRGWLIVGEGGGVSGVGVRVGIRG